MEEEPKFEKALERLEEIVEALEGGNMPLDEALKKYEEGVKLSRLCVKKLEQAETKVELLTRALNEDLALNVSDENSEEKKASRKKSKKGKEEEESNLLL